MAYAGQTIYNPISTERITFVKTTADTDGESLVFDCRVSPGSMPLPPHVHVTQEERFEVRSGTLGVMLGGKKFELQPGERVVLPAKIKHQWWNAGDDEVYIRVEAVPARNLETVLEVISAMAHAGKMNKKSMPRNPFYLANIGRMSETYLPVIPIWMQRIGLAMGSLTGRIFGIDPSFAKYRTTEALEAEYADQAAA